MSAEGSRSDVAVIKPEFCRERAIQKRYAEDTPSSQIATRRKSKRQKRRERRENEGKKLCRAFLDGACSNAAAECRFSHDVEEYLAAKPPPLPGQCVFRAANRDCPYGETLTDDFAFEWRLGVTCRFDHAATVETGSNEGLPAVDAAAALENVLTVDVRSGLRKGTYLFTRADAALAELSAESGGISAEVRLRAEEKSRVDFEGKLVLAPLTTLGNLPFRRICVSYGADVTVSEMALATNLLQGQQTEWALLKRHPSESTFGIQICGGYADALTRCAQLLEDVCSFDFLDINLGCPIDAVCQRGGGASLLQKPNRIKHLSLALSSVLQRPLTLKMRKGYHDQSDVVHHFIPEVQKWGVSAVTLHSRSRAQRYTKTADWQYLYSCAQNRGNLQFIGNGDIFSYTEWEERLSQSNGSLATCMIGRGALIKPWIFTEIKERRHWDISATERLEMLKLFCSRGLEHWGSDERGVETTRRFLLEWLSFLYRYVPVGILQELPLRIHSWPPPAVGRNDLETLFMSDSAQDWVRISEMLLGAAPEGFRFCPKHKSNAYSVD